MAFNQIIIIWLRLLFLYSILKESNANLLYNENDSVIELNAKNFFENVYNKNGIILVNFYLNWCPHCIQFSHIWKQLARDVNNWKPVVRIAAIDCATDENRDLCQNYGIIRFPRIRLFGVNALNDDLGIHFEVRHTMEEMRSEVIDYLLKIHQQFQHNLNVFPISIASKNELFNALPIDSQKYNLIFLEKQPSHLTAQIILDYSSFGEYLNFIRVNDRTGSLSDELFGHFIRLPSLIQIHSNQSFKLLASSNSDNEELLRQEFGSKIKQMVKTEEMSFSETKPTKVEKSNKLRSEVPKSVSFSLTDLYNTLRYSLHKEVVRNKILNSTQTQVLHNFFLIVYKYLPFDNENVRRFFKRMNIWFSIKRTELKSENLKAAMKISDGYLPPIVQWTHCGGSQPQFRGYPCGLWILFHVLTVEEYLRNTTDNSHEVLPLMRQLIINFFSCDECAKHFEITSRNLKSYLVRPESSVLWLWRVHNQINHRTKGLASEDPLYPKVQYPTQEMCVHCYKTNSEFDETKVFEFILENYDKKKFRKSSEYFAEQRILNKNFGHILVKNKYFLILLIILSTSFRRIFSD